VTLSIIPVHGIPEVRPRDDLVGLLLTALGSAREMVVDGDVLVIAQKIVSKSEGRVVRLADVVPSPRALAMAEESGKDPRQLEVVLGETKQIIRWERGVLIVETRHGFVCANAGVDRSNAGAPDTVVLLPVDPDASAARIRDEIADRAKATVAVVITDTFGRAWREGHTNVAIGIAGLPALKRYIGQRDPEGYELRAPRSLPRNGSSSRRSASLSWARRTPTGRHTSQSCGMSSTGMTSWSTARRGGSRIATLPRTSG
jgi:coenzyme F420-0:L-glutamate ligase/coenzyme F420-1:gamma-L-glutamate ligase